MVVSELSIHSGETVLSSDIANIAPITPAGIAPAGAQPHISPPLHPPLDPAVLAQLANSLFRSLPGNAPALPVQGGGHITRDAVLARLIAPQG